MRWQRKNPLGKWLLILFVLVLLVLFALPMIWTALMSFKGREDIFTLTPPFLPSQWRLDEYREVFSLSGVGRFFINSSVVAMLTTAISVVLASTCGYGLHRISGRSSERLSTAILMMRMVPTMVCTIPFYLLFRQFNLINSLPALALCYTALSMPLAIWLSLGFYRCIPESIYESGMVDGCTEWGLFIRIAFR